MNTHPANALFHALNKIKETNEQFHARMQDIARRAFRPSFDIDSLDPFKQQMKRRGNDNCYDGDGGREQQDHLDETR